MAIQFLCPGCSQPIEVDNEFAGKSATCPYCRRAVTVPESSTYDPAAAAAARPGPGAGTSAGAQPAPLDQPYFTRADSQGERFHPAAVPLPGRQLRSRSNRFAAGCCLISWLLLGVVVYYYMSQVIPRVLPVVKDASQPADQVERMREIVSQLPGMQFIALAMIAYVLLAIAGVVLSLKGLRGDRGWNLWPMVILALSGLPLAGMCCCFGFGMIMQMTGMRPPA